MAALDPLRWIAVLLLLVAAGIAAGMALSAWAGATLAGCAGDGCARVAASDYAWIAGARLSLPVSKCFTAIAMRASRSNSLSVT